MSSLGANSTIICGNNIGKYALIEPVIVTQNVPDYALMVGVPAKQIGWISEFGEKMDFDKSSKFICKHTNVTYELHNNKIIKK